MIRNIDSVLRQVKKKESESGRLQAKAGIPLTLAIQDAYAKCKEKPNSKSAKTKYMKLRLELHLRWNDEQEFLHRLDEACDLGLNDESVGPILWNVQPRVKTMTKINRVTSGQGLKGAISKTNRRDKED